MPKLTPEEEEIETLVEFWQSAEDNAKKAKDVADGFKEQVRVAMQGIGLKQHKTLAGSVALKETKKTNIIGPFNNPKKDREAFEDLLRRKGLYDQFIETKFSLDKVKAYCESENDDLWGTIEIQTNYTPVYYKGNQDKEA